MHRPVMSKQVIELLSPRPDGIFVDCTVGGGGHAYQICQCLKGKGRFVGIDQDKDALEYCRGSLKEFDGLVCLVCDNFKNLDEILDDLGIGSVNGILLDLGVSSFQLDNAHRGFSFRGEGPLDMRMDQSQTMTAAYIVNNLPPEELVRILQDFGQERWSRRITRAIIRNREKSPITTTGELTDIVLRAVPAGSRRFRIHPATRTFQALRIAVNDELEVLKSALEKSLDRLAGGGRIAVISFQSFEDRIVKHMFRDNSVQGRLDVLTKKPLYPDDDEIKDNPRSRSAKLRGAQKR